LPLPIAALICGIKGRARPRLSHTSAARFMPGSASSQDPSSRCWDSS
jgi:hypothetical protein